MRIMAIDYGDARTGIAISDRLCTIVGQTDVIHSRNREKTAAAILQKAIECTTQAYQRDLDARVSVIEAGLA